MKSLAAKLSILAVFLAVSGCAFATNGDWAYLRIGTTALKAFLQVMGTLR